MTEPAIYLREGVSERLQRMFDCDSNSAVAEIIGIDQSQYSRVANGGYRPGLKFMARLLRAIDGRVTFDELFEVKNEVVDEPLKQAS